MSADGYSGCAAAIRDMDIHRRLASVTAPALVIAGNLDTSTPFLGHGEHIVAAIPDAHVLHLDAAHLAPLEAPLELSAAILGFLVAPRWAA